MPNVRLSTPFLSATVVMASLLSAAVARAEPAAVAPAASAPEGSRFRFGLAGGGAYGWARADGYAALQNFGPALDLDLGVQTSSVWAFYAHLEVASLIFTNLGSAYGVAELTPTPWLSLGTGVGFDGHLTMETCSAVGGEDEPVDGPYGGGYGGGCGGTWSGLSVPLIIGFNFEGADRWRNELSRRTLRLQLSHAYGVDPTSGIHGSHSALTFGFADM